MSGGERMCLPLRTLTREACDANPLTRLEFHREWIRTQDVYMDPENVSSWTD